MSSYGISCCDIPNPSSYLKANAYYFDQIEWAKLYFKHCHRDDAFRERWHRATGGWNDKVVVDIGCGPGNLYASLGGAPRVLIGVDVSTGALEMASEIGYQPLLADAHELPFKSEFADLIALNATLHHCDDMEKVLAESARLVRPGGRLVVDQDPQLTAWDWKGPGKLLYNVRLPLYRIFCGHKKGEQIARLASETHHKPGRGVTPDLFSKVLAPFQFKYQLYPHNNRQGAEVFRGQKGRPGFKYQIGQILSGIDPGSPEGALSLMCVAEKLA